jgi:hypothetical protein
MFVVNVVDNEPLLRSLIQEWRVRRSALLLAAGREKFGGSTFAALMTGFDPHF